MDTMEGDGGDKVAACDNDANADTSGVVDNVADGGADENADVSGADDDPDAFGAGDTHAAVANALATTSGDVDDSDDSDSESIIDENACVIEPVIFHFPYSAPDVIRLKGIMKYCAMRFPIGAVFDSRRALTAKAQQTASKQGFHFSPKSSALYCNKSEAIARRNETKRGQRHEKARSVGKAVKERSAKPGFCKCNVFIKFSAVDSKNKDCTKVKVTNTNFQHDFGCTPSPQQSRAGRQAGGYYRRLISTEATGAIRTIANIVKYSGASGATAKQIRRLLSPILPKGTNIDSTFIHNVRVNIAYRLKKGELDHLLNGENVNLTPSEKDKILSIPEDSISPEYISLAEQVADETLRTVLLEMGDADAMLGLLENLHRKDPMFLFDIQKDSNGDMVGFVWQTAGMRRDWDDCAPCIFLDAMKRQMNSANWPYMSVCVLDGYNKVSAVCEALCIGERLDAYAWMLRSCSNFSTQRKLGQIYCIYGDGLITSGDSTLTNLLGIQDTCRLLEDTHHLLSIKIGDWPKRFGLTRWSCYESLFKALVYQSYTPEDYNRTYAEIRTLMVENREPDDLLVYVEDMIDARKAGFARFAVSKVHFNESRKGSSPSESNHASIVARVGRGSSEEPSVEIKNLLLRETELNNLRAVVRANHHLTLRGLYDTMKYTDPERATMSLALSSRGFELGNVERDQSRNYSVIGLDASGENKMILRKGRDESTVRTCDGEVCDCDTFIAFHIQCRHLFCYHEGQFVKSLWNKKWQEQLMIGSSKPNPVFVAALTQSGFSRTIANGSIGDYMDQMKTTEDVDIIDDAAGQVDVDDDAAGHVDVDVDAENTIPTINEENTPISKTIDISPAVAKTPDVQLRKIPHKDFQSAFNVVANAAAGLSSAELQHKVMGAILSFQDLLKNEPHSNDFTKVAEQYLNSFATNRVPAGSNAFGQPVLSATAAKRKNPYMSKTAGRPSQKRMRSRNEHLIDARSSQRSKSAAPAGLPMRTTSTSQLISAKARPSKCSFCLSEKHRVQTCGVLMPLKRYEVVKVLSTTPGLEAVSPWVWWQNSLGNPKAHCISTAGTGMSQRMKSEGIMDQVPKEAMHCIAIQSFYSNEHFEFSQERRSVYKSVKDIAGGPTPGENIIYAKFLERGGSTLDIESVPSNTAFLRARTIQFWLSTRAARGTKSRFFCEMPMNPMI